MKYIKLTVASFIFAIAPKANAISLRNVVFTPPTTEELVEIIMLCEDAGIASDDCYADHLDQYPPYLENFDEAWEIYEYYLLSD